MRNLPIVSAMRTLFFETTTFTATVGHYLTDDEYRLLQSYMLQHPEVGDVMPPVSYTHLTLPTTPYV